MDGDMEALNPDLDMAAADDDAVKELDEMKKRLREMEDEAAALREMHAKVEKEMAAQDNIGSHEKQEQRDSHFQPPIPPGRNYESFPATNILL